LRDKSKVADFPIIRGVVTFVESLITGMKTLNYSASFWEEEEERQEQEAKEVKDRKPNDKETKDKQAKDKKESVWMGLITVLAVVLAVGIFVVVPFLISETLKKPIPSAQLRGLIEGVLRVLLFVLYVKLISQMEDIKRVFMYHGAEHKSINCVESGRELTVENVREQTTVHKRCGTSFLLIVMFVSVLFFMFIVVGNIWLRMILRILLIPVIAGLSYEFIRYAGSHDNKVVSVLSKPGLMLQSLTTAEPTDDMIEVAIASVEAVFDWKTFIKTEQTGETEKSEKTEKPEKTEKAKKPEKPKKTEKTDEKSEIEIVDIDDDNDEDDEILNALDRYFEAPPEKRGEDDKK
jgi:uncharacterized protein YqhQ